MKKFIFPNNDIFIEKYEELKSAQKVAEYFGCSKKTVLNHAKEIGYVNKKVYKLTDEDKEKIIEQYEKKTSTELAKEYNVSRGMITKLWYDMQLKGKEHRKYYLNNQDYFYNIDCPEKAYLLGFIASDGCVYNKKKNYQNAQNILKVTIQKDDEEILNFFKKELDTNKPISYLKRENFEYATLEIVSDKIFNDLELHNIVPNKTYINSWATLENEQFRPDFIRGYFDGDGSITKKDFDKNHLSSVNITISGWERDLNKFKEYLETKNIESIFVEDKRKRDSKYGLFGHLTFVNKKQKYNFLNFIYYNKNYTSLIRKQNQAEKYIKFYKSSSINNAD